ncbi:MAG: hypothetical protein IKP39_00560, partial [Paludibacteraceae bacterium]|nr:hypothetical protein [Paludibacteraceae bacterium]
NWLGVPPPMYIVRTGSPASFLRAAISVSTASVYASRRSKRVVEKKSQYKQRFLQNGIWT